MTSEEAEKGNRRKQSWRVHCVPFLAGGSAWPAMGSEDESAEDGKQDLADPESVTEQNIDCTGVQLRERNGGQGERDKHTRQGKEALGIWL